MEKKYILYFDTENGIGERVDYIKYNTKEEVNTAIMEYKRIDKICGNNNEYIVKEVFI